MGKLKYNNVILTESVKQGPFLYFTSLILKKKEVISCVLVASQEFRAFVRKFT